MLFIPSNLINEFMLMKLSVWAKKQGISYRTAWRWFKDGKLPVKAEQTGTGTILIKESTPHDNEVVIYARVSSSDQKGDLDTQISRLVQFANSRGWVVTQTITEIGSAMNGHRPKLKKLLTNPDIKTILIEHSDRLMRFGVEYLETALAAQGRKIAVADPNEVKNDLVQDMIEVLTSFCARLYGRRSARNRARKAIESIQNENQ
jgi:putative resolvase